MAEWAEIWGSGTGDRLWPVPDPGVAAICKHWKQSGAISRVLDLGYGIGRHLRLLDDEGFEAHGADNAAPAVRLCEPWIPPARLQLAGMRQIASPDSYFDALIGYNVIYHGDRDDVVATLAEVRRLLRPGGECYLTIPSRENRRYGNGAAPGPHTFASPGTFSSLFGGQGEAGEPHYFASREDLLHLAAGFEILTLQHREMEITRNGAQPVRIPKAFFWILTARKPVRSSVARV